MGVSKNSTEQDHGQVLVDRCFAEYERLTYAIKKFDKDKEKWASAGVSDYGLRQLQETLKFAAHRLAFLEMAVKGLTFMELHDAQAYAKFVASKRKIEDMDTDELRAFLRGM